VAKDAILVYLRTFPIPKKWRDAYFRKNRTFLGRVGTARPSELPPTPQEIKLKTKCLSGTVNIHNEVHYNVASNITFFK